MLTREPTEQMIAEWKRVFKENRGKLSPDRKTGAEVDKYFRRKYAPLPYADEEFLQLVREDLLSNQFSREKLPKGAVPHIVAYKAGNVLAGIDLVSGFFHVESEEIREAEKVYDDLFVFRGLDERDLENYFLVSEYIRLKKK